MPLLPRRLSLLPRRLSLPAVAAALICALSGLCALGLVSGTGTAAAASASARQCADPHYPARRDDANPLMLRPAPSGSDVLRGADFFVAGPARGTAAGAIAQMLGIGVGEPLAEGQPLGGLSDSLSWPAFERSTVATRIQQQSVGTRDDITLLEKIANEPTPLRISAYSGGGSPAAVSAQTTKLFCTVLRADPGTVPIVTTYFAHAELGGCSSTAEIAADAPRFRAQVNAMAEAIGRRPVALFLELDAVGSSRCMQAKGSLTAWESLIRYEALRLEALPHTAVYLEGGYSDSNNAAYAARLLNRMGIRQVQGFFTNDTHMQWTSHELRYAEAVSARTGGAHFVINTSSNGRGPALNPHPRTEGVEDLCNPPGRGLGIPDTTTPGLDPHLDALLWVVPPGASSGSCNGGPSSGTFWLARAEALAANANLQLGPGSPSKPF
jgi:endoglucanase